ncbi:MAG TPA: C40 family peptidase [Gemmatimonadaceae bacterium]|nr:C40 family peptidase [Gemmatimonadaceae bacterium]
MPTSAAPHIRAPRPLRVAAFVLAAAVLGVPAARAQDAKPGALPGTSVAVPGSRLSEVLNAVPATAGPRPFARLTESPDALRDSIVALARAQIGRRYVRGGASPQRGFDCSGLVKYVLGLLDISAPRTARLQARIGEAVVKDTSELEPGDLLTFGRSARGASHVAIYVGDGRYVHASVTAGRVIETSLDRRNSSLVRAWRGVRRILEPAAADTGTKKGDG